MTSQEGIRVRPKEERDKIKRRQRINFKNRLSPGDEDTEKIGDQKLKNEGLEEEKDHFALVVEKDCKYISYG